MKKRDLKLSIGLLLFSSLFFMTSCKKETKDPNVIIEDLFKKDASGWTIVGDAQGGYVEPTYYPDGGVDGGYIYAEDDVVGGVWYFNAPNSYLGNKSDYYNATLKYSLFQESGMKNQFKFEDIIFKSGDQKLFYLHESTSNFPNADWTNYSIKINADVPGWYIGTYKNTYNGPEQQYSVATESEMKEILSNLTEFRIRGEFEVGKDAGGLDKVQFIK